MGTILRTAAAAGVDGLMLAPGCIDPYNPKVVRGGMGAHLRLPMRKVLWEELASLLRGADVWVALSSGGEDYAAIDWRNPSVVIIGSEAHGVSAKALTLARGLVSIPMQAATESLNAAVATAIILFEANRQRRLAHRRPAA
jgi:TrmH family RNA methyltransferase